ncbi:MAG TPA: choice-of-anchor tandem repeat GloVer-containing protein [Rhizomicrobium sp.]
MRSKRRTPGSFCLAFSALLASTAIVQAADFHPLYSFAGPDGAFPMSTPIFDGDGNLYATTFLGGSCPAFEDGCGTVFVIAADGTESVLHAFKGQAADGDGPLGNFVRDGDGNFFGVTQRGGGHGCDQDRGCGTVFRLTSGGREKLLYAFAGGNDGSSPNGLVTDSLGTLYGTTMFGGSHGFGTVFRVSPRGKFKLLYSFAGGSDGGNPAGSLVLDNKGNLYGTTQFGGSDDCSTGCGTVFQVRSDGGEKVVYAFRGGDEGYQPMAGLLPDGNGGYYGTTFYGGGDGCGTVFHLDSGGKEAVLHNFTEQDGCSPQATLIGDKQGNLYGTTQLGGADSFGTVFQLAPDGQESVLYAFTGAGDGCLPEAALVKHKGQLYGTALTCGSTFNGTVFSVRP